MPKDFDVELVQKEKLTHDIYLFSFRVPTTFSFTAGQFLMLDVHRTLRRPFAIFNYTNNILQILVKIKGRGTQELIKSNIGNKFKILAPLGNGYTVNSKSKLVLIAGGIGLASIYPLAKELEKANIPFTMVLGVKTFKDIPKIPYPQNTIIYTEEHSSHLKGYPTEFLNNKKNMNIFACGPITFIQALKKYARHNKIAVSLEAKMACGLGACLSCVIETKNGLKRVCKDGPVFDILEL